MEGCPEFRLSSSSLLIIYDANDVMDFKLKLIDFGNATIKPQSCKLDFDLILALDSLINTLTTIV